MPFEIELHPAPYLKGLIDGQNISGRQEHGSTFTYSKTHMKGTDFTSYRANTVIGKAVLERLSRLHFTMDWSFKTR